MKKKQSAVTRIATWALTWLIYTTIVLVLLAICSWMLTAIPRAFIC